jgi:hypothetical protein
MSDYGIAEPKFLGGREVIPPGPLKLNYLPTDILAKEAVVFLT